MLDELPEAGVRSAGGWLDELRVAGGWMVPACVAAMLSVLLLEIFLQYIVINIVFSHSEKISSKFS
jgi:hypothetical protein